MIVRCEEEEEEEESCNIRHVHGGHQFTANNFVFFFLNKRIDDWWPLTLFGLRAVWTLLAGGINAGQWLFSVHVVHVIYRERRNKGARAQFSATHFFFFFFFHCFVLLFDGNLHSVVFNLNIFDASIFEDFFTKKNLRFK